ncbi:NUDIX hydrolase [Streptomyces canus]|uniref:NUDIX hydrolase n=1 Tax=Streptomyces canus TaxID=58343 RepID=UPI0022560976|nr:NUDIX hydrolase [Streptomyces canus]MCX4852688.1 NUDIX hydrolase [Streptomyces canus]WSW32113.1 NUDIX hydrolase [Streptomyces canus]
MADLLEAGGLRLVEVAPPVVPAELRTAMDREWGEAVLANPALFDGPVAVCAGLSREAPDDLLVSWSRVTYRYLALSRVPGATALRSLFVSVVQPADDGRVLVGRMSSSTAAPGRWQLPGGSVEPPTGDEPLDEPALRRHAAVELAEETGVDLPAADLTRCLVTHGEDGQVGVLYLAPPLPASSLRESFMALVAAETARGRASEFDRIAFVGSPAELPDLDGPHVDYLDPLVRWASRRVGS